MKEIFGTRLVKVLNETNAVQIFKRRASGENTHTSREIRFC